MTPGLATYALSFAAGGLSTLSPCVLPLVPILVGSAATAHRMGPWALAAGLGLSFAAMGVALASLGGAFGLDPDVVRITGAGLLIAIGVLLASPRLHARFALATAGVSGTGQGLLAQFSLNGLSGQFLLGLLLGLVWTPCVGPTLGAAVTLASQGEQLAQVALVMALFGLGAGLPLAGLGLLSREAMIAWRGKLAAAGRHGKVALGALLAALGVAVLLGLDKRIEAWALDAAPAWLTRIGTLL
jgi:cytochrome c biogenesis protein CcdA